MPAFPSVLAYLPATTGTKYSSVGNPPPQCPSGRNWYKEQMPLPAACSWLNETLYILCWSRSLLPWETGGRRGLGQRRPLVPTGCPYHVSPRRTIIGTSNMIAKILGRDALAGSNRRTPKGMTESPRA